MSSEDVQFLSAVVLAVSLTLAAGLWVTASLDGRGAGWGHACMLGLTALTVLALATLIVATVLTPTGCPSGDKAYVTPGCG